MADWYPKTQAELIAWHDNFSTQAAINGTTLGLTAGIVTQIAQDAENVLVMLNGMEAANAYRQALTEFKALLFNAPRGGAWEQIGVSMVDEFIDTRAPLVAGAPEVREYRVQGMENNARVGPNSEVSTVSTVP